MTKETSPSVQEDISSDSFISEAAGRTTFDGKPIWKFQRDVEREAKKQAAEAHAETQARAIAKREELIPLLGTFKERMAPPKAKDPAELAKAAVREAANAAHDELYASTFSDRVGTGVAKIEEHDNGLSKIADKPSRLQDNLDANREEKADRARHDAEKAAKLEAQMAVSKEAWKTGPKSGPKVPNNQIEWSGGGPVSDAVKAGQRSKDDILNDPMPWTVSIKQNKNKPQ